MQLQQEQIQYVDNECCQVTVGPVVSQGLPQGGGGQQPPSQPLQSTAGGQQQQMAAAAAGQAQAGFPAVCVL